MDTCSTNTGSTDKGGGTPGNRPTIARGWWLGAGALVLAPTLGFGSLQVASRLGASTERVTTRYSGVERMVIHNDAGNVTLRATDEETVTVRRRARSGLQGPNYRERQQADQLELSAGCRPIFDSTCYLDLDVSVPSNIDVDVVGAGNLRTDGVNGSIRMRANGGGITVVGGTDSLDLSSSGGGVTVVGSRASTVKAASSGGGVTVAFDTPPSAVDAHSSGGGVTVTVPEGPEAYLVKASSSGGPTLVGIRTDPTSANSITTASSGGGVTVAYSTPSGS